MMFQLLTGLDLKANGDLTCGLHVRGPGEPRSHSAARETGNLWLANLVLTHFITDLTHLELEETPLLLHLLSDFSASDLGPDHPVLLGVLSLLLLDFCTDRGEDKSLNQFVKAITQFIVGD